jgi:hypothetical protein
MAKQDKNYNQRKEQAIKIWKENNITSGNFEFSCGGDSMNDWNITFTDKAGNEVENEDLKGFIEDDVFKNVEFYVNSDGYYIGEAGNVSIELNEDDNDFNYSKSAQSEWNEIEHIIAYVDLTDEEVALLKAKVFNINGSYNTITTINYKNDCILSTKEHETLTALIEKIDEVAANTKPDTDNFDEEWYIFTTNDENSELTELTIEDNKLKIDVEVTIIEYRDSE